MPKPSQPVLDGQALYRQKARHKIPNVAPNVPLKSGADGADFAVDVDRFVAGRIRQRRRELGMNQRDFAKALGVSLQQVHKYETGANRVSAGRLYVMADTLGVQVDYFYPPAALTGVTEEASRDLVDLKRMVNAIHDPAHREALKNVCSLFLRAERGDTAMSRDGGDA